METRFSEMKDVVGRNVRDLRRSHDLSQQQLADALTDAKLLPWTQSLVADIEVGDRQVRVDECVVLMLFFQVGAEELLAPPIGKVRIGADIVLDRDGLRRCFQVKGRSEVVDAERTVTAFSGLRSARMTPKLKEELREWRELGGDPAELKKARDRVARGEWNQQRYAVWKRHARASLERGE